MAANEEALLRLSLDGKGNVCPHCGGGITIPVPKLAGMDGFKIGDRVARIGWDNPFDVIGFKNEGGDRGMTVKAVDEFGDIHHFRSERLEPWDRTVEAA